MEADLKAPTAFRDCWGAGGGDPPITAVFIAGLGPFAQEVAAKFWLPPTAETARGSL